MDFSVIFSRMFFLLTKREFWTITKANFYYQSFFCEMSGAFFQFHKCYSFKLTLQIHKIIFFLVDGISYQMSSFAANQEGQFKQLD